MTKAVIVTVVTMTGINTQKVVESHVSPDGFELGGLGVGHVELGGVEGVV